MVDVVTSVVVPSVSIHCLQSSCSSTLAHYWAWQSCRINREERWVCVLPTLKAIIINCWNQYTQTPTSSVMPKLLLFKVEIYCWQWPHFMALHSLPQTASSYSWACCIASVDMFSIKATETREKLLGSLKVGTSVWLEHSLLDYKLVDNILIDIMSWGIASISMLLWTLLVTARLGM